MLAASSAVHVDELIIQQLMPIRCITWQRPGNHARLTSVNMRVDRNQQSGNLGEVRVIAALAEIGWAPPVKVPHDIGDDLITFARVSVPGGETPGSAGIDSHDLFDLSVPVLVQVKTSRTGYRKSKSTHEGRKGWWFHETTSDHFDHWLRFGLPYLLVLHDETGNQSYWAHVHRSHIVATDNSRKIFVPSNQTLTRSSIAALNEVAVSARAEKFSQLYVAGSILTPGQRLRHALITPHIAMPELGEQRNLTYDQVVAMIVLDRQSHLSRAVYRENCPDPTTWRSHQGWGWRFADALYHVLQGSGDSSTLASLAEKAPSKYERDACRVVHGCIAYAELRFSDALTAFSFDRYSKPADRAWLQVHRAHAFLQVGNSASAADSAKTALECLQAESGDLSATVIRAAATDVLYRAASDVTPDQRHAAALVAIAAQNNLGSLQRADALSEALAVDLEQRFQSWSGNHPGYSGTDESTAFTRLTATAWNAAFSAAWSDWRSLTRRAAQVSFVNSVDVDEIDTALTSLVRSSGKKEARIAASRVWLNGPIEALRRTVGKIADSEWDPWAEGVVLEILSAGGDLLGRLDSDKTIGRIISLLSESGAVRQVPGLGWTDRWSEVDTALARLLFSASNAGHEMCAGLVIREFGGDDFRAGAVLRIAHELRISELEEKTRIELVNVAKSRNDRHRAALLETLAKEIPEAFVALKELAARKEGEASRALLAIGDTVQRNWTMLGRESADSVRAMVENAQVGKFSFGTRPFLHDLALAAFHTRNSQHWKLVTDALTASVLSGEQMDRCVQFLASRYDELPSYVRTRLKRLAPALHTRELDQVNPGSFDAAVFALRVAVGLLDEGETLAGLLETRRSAGVDFVGVVGNMPISDREAFMLACTVDPDPHVRAQAAFGIVRFASETPERAPVLATALRKSLQLSDGCRMSLGAGYALKQFVVDGFDQVRDELKAHPSGVVRRLVT